MIYDEDDWITLNEAAAINGLTLSGAARRYRAGHYGEHIRASGNRVLVRRESVIATGPAAKGSAVGALTALQFDVLDLLAVTGSVSTSELHRRCLSGCKQYTSALRRLNSWIERADPAERSIEIAYYCTAQSGDSVDASRGITTQVGFARYEPVWQITEHGRRVLDKAYAQLEASGSVENDSQLLDAKEPA